MVIATIRRAVVRSVDLVGAGAARVMRRVDRSEAGMELVQMAIALFIVGVMASALLTAVNAFWPGFVASVLNDIEDKLFG